MPYPHPELPSLRQITTSPYLHKRCSKTILSVSEGSLGPGATQGLFEPSECHWQEPCLILNVNLRLLPSCWGFSFAHGRGVSPHSHSSVYHLTGIFLTLDMGYLLSAIHCSRTIQLLKCKGRKSRNPWSNRPIWPWSTE